MWKLRHWRWVSFLIASALAGAVTVSRSFFRDCSALQAVTRASSAASEHSLFQPRWHHLWETFYLDRLSLLDSFVVTQMHTCISVTSARGRLTSRWGQLVGSNFFSQHSSCWKKESAHSQGILTTTCASLRLTFCFTWEMLLKGIGRSVDISTLVTFVNQPRFHSILG